MKPPMYTEPMNSPTASFATQVPRWAARQLADYDARRPGTLFAEGVVLDVEQGYALQTTVADLRRERGERVIGYKVGCTSPLIRAQLGIGHCVTGRLFDSERHPSGCALHRSGFANLAIEGELAVELARPPEEQDFSVGGIPACVGRVFPVIELHNHLLRGEKASAGELIANNAIHAGFVAGDGVAPTDVAEGSLGPPALSISADGRLLEECAGDALLETIRASLQWLDETLRGRGDKLGAGQVVLTGSVPSLIPLAEDCRLRVEAPPFGSVEAIFVA